METINVSKGYAHRAPLNARLELVVSTDLKRRVFETAAAQGKSPSEFIREALAASALQAA